MMAIQASSLGFSPLIPFMKDAWGMSYTQVGTFTGLYGLVALVMSLPAGLLAKRFGEKRILLLGLALAAVGPAAVAMCERLSAGVGRPDAVAHRLSTRLHQRHDGRCGHGPGHWRGKAMGLLGALTALATILGSGFSARMEAAFGWRLSMVGFAAIAAAGACASLGFTDRFPAEARPSTCAEPRRRGCSPPSKYPVVWPIPLLGLANAGGFAATFFVPSVVRTVFHGDAVAGVSRSSRPRTRWPSSSIRCAGGWRIASTVGWSWPASVPLMVPACLLMSSHEISTCSVLRRRCWSAWVMRRRTRCIRPRPVCCAGAMPGPIMGIVGLGSGLFGYLGPLALGGCATTPAGSTWAGT